MSDWGTPTPPLAETSNLCKILERRDGLDIHTITVTLYDGLWLLKVQATDEEMQDHDRYYMLDSHGVAGDEIDPRGLRL
jgi:hypothetical protein